MSMPGRTLPITTSDMPGLTLPIKLSRRQRRMEIEANVKRARERIERMNNCSICMRGFCTKDHHLCPKSKCLIIQSCECPPESAYCLECFYRSVQSGASVYCECGCDRYLYKCPFCRTHVQLTADTHNGAMAAVVN